MIGKSSLPSLIRWFAGTEGVCRRYLPSWNLVFGGLLALSELAGLGQQKGVVLVYLTLIGI